MNFTIGAKPHDESTSALFKFRLLHNYGRHLHVPKEGSYIFWGKVLDWFGWFSYADEAWSFDQEAYGSRMLWEFFIILRGRMRIGAERSFAGYYWFHYGENSAIILAVKVRSKKKGQYYIEGSVAAAPAPATRGMIVLPFFDGFDFFGEALETESV